MDDFQRQAIHRLRGVASPGGGRRTHRREISYDMSRSPGGSAERPPPASERCHMTCLAHRGLCCKTPPGERGTDTIPKQLFSRGVSRFVTTHVFTKRGTLREIRTPLPEPPDPIFFLGRPGSELHASPRFVKTRVGSCTLRARFVKTAVGSRFWTQPSHKPLIYRCFGAS